MGNRASYSLNSVPVFISVLLYNTNGRNERQKSKLMLDYLISKLHLEIVKKTGFIYEYVTYGEIFCIKLVTNKISLLFLFMMR